MLELTISGGTPAKARPTPLVIESIGQPISSPVDSSGKYVELLVPMTLCTLTAPDREDWKRVSGS